MNRRRASTIPVLALAVALLSACGDGDPVTPAGAGITGNWSGSWASNFGMGGDIEFAPQQSGTAVTGNATMTGSPCFSGGSVTGTVSGASVAIGVLAGAGQQVDLAGTVAPDGTAMGGNYTVSGGLCDGDSGTWELTRN